MFTPGVIRHQTSHPLGLRMGRMFMLSFERCSFWRREVWRGRPGAPGEPRATPHHPPHAGCLVIPLRVPVLLAVWVTATFVRLRAEEAGGVPWIDSRCVEFRYNSTPVQQSHSFAPLSPHSPRLRALGVHQTRIPLPACLHGSRTREHTPLHRTISILVSRYRHHSSPRN